MRGRDRRAEERERIIKYRRSLGRLTDDQATDQLREVRERVDGTDVRDSTVYGDLVETEDDQTESVVFPTSVLSSPERNDDGDGGVF